ncbi:MAG: hypothetical protein AAB570_03035, partial [Patescibacteria group bacterium]
MKHSPPRLEIKSATRLIEHGRPQTHVVAICIPLEHKNGYVFLLAEVASRSKSTMTLHALFQETAERLARRLQEHSHLQHRFEQALQALNGDLKDIFTTRDIMPHQLSACIGVVQRDVFIVAGAGALTAFFLRKNARQNVRFFDLMQNLASESGPPTEEKFFATVLDGTLSEEDVMLFATGPFQKYVSLEASHPLFTTLPPTSVLESIDAHFPIRAQSGIILFQIKPEKNVLTGYSQTLGADESMRALTRAETDATQQLGLQAPHVQEAFSRLVSLVRSGSAQERIAFTQNAARRVWKGTRIITSYIFRVASNAASALISFLGALFERRGKRKRGFSQAMSAWSRTWKTGRYQFFKLSKSHRLILLVSLSLVIALGLSLSAVRTAKRSSADTQAFQQSIDRANELVDAAQASLIYNDRASAGAQLREAESILVGLDSDKEERRDAMEATRQTLAATWNDVRRVLTPSLTRLMVPSQNAVDTNGSLVFTAEGNAWRISGGTLTESPITNASSLHPVRGTPYKFDTVFLASDDRMARYRAPEGSLQSVLINAAEAELRQAVALEQYGERLYILVPEQNQIYRHQLIDDRDYASALPWLTDAVTFDRASDLAIDGTVWVADGARVRHFDRGVEIGFAQTTIEPPLQNATALFTDTDITELFVLEGAQNRLLVLNKQTGELLGQYVDPSFGPSTDMFINYTDRTAYVVTPNQILLFPLTGII